MVRLVSGVSALLVLAGRASGPRERESRPPSGFEGAARLVDQGRHDEALPILRCVARHGEGFEIAQYLAGHSALALSRSETTPSILRDEMRVEGFDRLISAAAAGWPAAQAELAEAFHAVDTDAGAIEAGYWAALYRSNARERAYGLDRLDNRVETEIAARLTPAARAQIDARVEAYVPAQLPRQEITPECAAHVRTGGRPGGAEGGQGRRPTGRGGNGERPGGGDRPGGPGGS